MIYSICFILGLLCGVLVTSTAVFLSLKWTNRIEPCPQCNGVGGYELAPNDWVDCEICDCTGYVVMKEKK